MENSASNTVTFCFFGKRFLSFVLPAAASATRTKSVRPRHFKEATNHLKSNLGKSPSGADLSLAGLHPLRATKVSVRKLKKKKRKRNDQGDALLCVSDWQPRQRAESLKFVRLHLYLPLRALVSTSSPSDTIRTTSHHCSLSFRQDDGNQALGSVPRVRRSLAVLQSGTRARFAPAGDARWGGGDLWSRF